MTHMKRKLTLLLMCLLLLGGSAYVITFEDGAESDGASAGISVAEIIEEAGLGEVIYIPDTPALLADFGSDSTVRYSYGWYGGGTIYYGTKTGTLGPIYLGSPAGYHVKCNTGNKKRQSANLGVKCSCHTNKLHGGKRIVLHTFYTGREKISTKTFVGGVVIPKNRCHP